MYLPYITRVAIEAVHNDFAVFDEIVEYRRIRDYGSFWPAPVLERKESHTVLAVPQRTLGFKASVF